MSRFLRQLVALSIAIAFLFPPTVQAIPYDITIWHFDGCGSGKYEVGYYNKDCFGVVSSSGTQSGAWKVIYNIHCPDSSENWHYQQWCGGTWVGVSESHFDNSCSCP